LVIAANRDEYHARPTLDANIWETDAHVLGGRDLSAGGTWLGMRSDGRIGLLTNFREPGHHNPAAPSRGSLVGDYLCSKVDAQTYSHNIAQQAAKFNGFNLLLIDPSQALYFTNRLEPSIRQLGDGVMGLSNSTLGVPWPKLTRTRQAISELLAQPSVPGHEDLFAIFRDTVPAPDDALPDTGLSKDRERLLSSPFILSPEYGTRCTTLILQHADGYCHFYERRYDSSGTISGTSCWRIDPAQQSVTPVDIS
jgi:uncharacterized protein with NRDE domain